MNEAQSIDQSFNCIRDTLTLMRSGRFTMMEPIRRRLTGLGYTADEINTAFRRIANEYEKQGDYANEGRA